MDLVAFTRQLVDIESISGNELAVGECLLHELAQLDFKTERMQVAPERFNVWAYSEHSAAPAIVFSTHMDTVPPFIRSSEDSECVYGRGTCDAKGILAAQVSAALKLRETGIHAGLLFVVGEERDSQGATVANQQARGSKFLINGEPTENRLSIASKGALRANVIAQGKMAHSAYPELGESAIDKLLNALERVRRIELPRNEEVGPSTMNIGIIEGGRAPNVISDFARAQLLVRLVGPAEELKKEISRAAEPDARAEYVLEIPFTKLRTVPGIDTMIASFTTDIPKLSNWGEPLLLGPGSIRVAHTDGEFLSKKDLFEAVELYVKISQHLLASPR
jgi:acetylornithine deacetylase